MKEYVMGNGAIALGALKAGVNVVCGYPGTPSSEIIETIAAHPHEGMHLEWSVNEKSAMEVAASATYSGARALVTMKQVGLNVASDPLMSLAYVGVEGGMVIVSADDPGPISSQTEQDTRRFADFARIPVFDPSSPEEAFEMIQDAFDYSEKYHTPVLFRPVTRVCHAYASIETDGSFTPKEYSGFQKDSNRWVIFPRLSFKNHGMMEERNIRIGQDFSSYRFNTSEGDDASGSFSTSEENASSMAVLTGGVSYMYAKEYLKDHPGIKLIRIATAFPFPEDFILRELEGIKEVLCFEELSPYLEEQLLKLAGKNHLSLTVYGKLTGHVPAMGENSTESFINCLTRCGFLPCQTGSAAMPSGITDTGEAPTPPPRPPVLCAGCPHRASFYAVKQAMKGKKAVFCGDIGCYTLGNAMPLDMVDTCLCMGAGVTMAQGFAHTDPDVTAIAFIGDSTFFASGMTGVVNAVYNEANIIICILDNSTTAMTGHQPHPGTGRNMMGHVTEKVSIARILEGIGVKKVITADPLDLPSAVQAVTECADAEGVKAIIFKSPCIAIEKSGRKCVISDTCTGCRKCIREIGCPALTFEDGKVRIDSSLCTGCGLCGRVCPFGAVRADSPKLI